jgi:predicted secreted acid phosphatase
MNHPHIIMNYELLEKISGQIKTYLDIVELPKNPVVIYDIDDTLIDDYGKPICPIIDTYRYARQKGIKTVLITARVGVPEAIKFTNEQLQKYGLCDNLYTYFRPPNRTDVERYKLMARQNIYEKGYNAVMSIGDMPWDVGPYSGVGVLLPRVMST